MLTCRACLGRALSTKCSPQRVSPAHCAEGGRLASTFSGSTSAGKTHVLSPAVKPFRARKGFDRSQEGIIYDEKNREKLRWAAHKHLQYMEDPFNIAQHVSEALFDKEPGGIGDQNFAKMLAIVQRASSDRNVVVAWNHLIDFQMKRQRLGAAIKLFNDMKKRGQQPNNRTYTIVFRGCSHSHFPKRAAAEALRIHTALANDEKTTANIIHLNAALEACGRAGDLDSMFMLLEWLEEKQMNPTTTTFTTILHGLRAAALEPRDNPFADQRSRIRPHEKKRTSVSDALERAEITWQEAVRQWRVGSVVIDEHLVNAMGRSLLLLGGAQRSGDIFALLEQTMGLENIAPRTGKANDMFAPRAKLGSLAEPGTKTLALVLDAFLTGDIRRSKPVMRYWHELVTKRGVVPDYSVWQSIFKLLHKCRSSTETASLLPSLPTDCRSKYVFRTAMWTCSRNTDHPNILANAGTVIDTMVTVGDRPIEGNELDLTPLWTYLQIAKGRAKASRANETAWSAYCRQVAEALQRVWEPYHRASETAGLPEIVKSGSVEGVKHNRIGELIAIARAMISLTSQVSGTVDKKTRKTIDERASSLNRDVVALAELGLKGASWAETKGESNKKPNDGAGNE